MTSPYVEGGSVRWTSLESLGIDMHSRQMLRVYVKTCSLKVCSFFKICWYVSTLNVKKLGKLDVKTLMVLLLVANRSRA